MGDFLFQILVVLHRSCVVFFSATEDYSGQEHQEQNEYSEEYPLYQAGRQETI